MNVTKERRGYRSTRHSVLKDFLFLTACAQCSFTRETHVHSTVQYRAWIFKLLRPGHRLHGIDSWWEISVVEFDSWRHRFHVKELKTTELSSSYIVCGEWQSYWSTHFQHAIYDSRRQRMKADSWTGIFKQSMGARNRVGIGLSYRPARRHRLAEFIPWNLFPLGSINV